MVIMTTTVFGSNPKVFKRVKQNPKDKNNSKNKRRKTNETKLKRREKVGEHHP